MKSKIPLKYRIIFIILLLPIIITSLTSLLTPYDLLSNKIIGYGSAFSIFAAVGIDIYGMYTASGKKYKAKHIK